MGGKLRVLRASCRKDFSNCHSLAWKAKRDFSSTSWNGFRKTRILQRSKTVVLSDYAHKDRVLCRLGYIGSLGAVSRLSTVRRSGREFSWRAGYGVV